VKHRVSDNVGGVKHFWDALPRALGRVRHFALVEDVPFQPRLARNQFPVRNLSPTHASLRSHNCDHDYQCRLPREGERDAQSITRCWTAHHRDVRAVPRADRTFQLLLIPSLKPRDAELQKCIVVLLCRVRIPIPWLNRF